MKWHKNHGTYSTRMVNTSQSEIDDMLDLFHSKNLSFSPMLSYVAFYDTTIMDGTFWKTKDLLFHSCIIFIPTHAYLLNKTIFISEITLCDYIKMAMFKYPLNI